MSRRRITSLDVARAAGVSRTTVSFVLNNAPNQTIPESTRTAVLEAAQSLGYTPSAAARALRSGSSQLVLVLGPQVQPSELMDAGMLTLTSRLRDAGYATIVAMSSDTTTSMDVLWQSVSPAAVVSMLDMPATTRSMIQAMNIPIVDALFHTVASFPGRFELQVDVGRQQARHVAERGATELLVVHPPARFADATIINDRRRGVTEFAEERGLAHATLEVHPDDRQQLDALLHRVQHTAASRVAICAFNDLIAFAILQAAHDRGMDAPADFLLIGVDDLPVIPYISPALSSVRFEIVDHIEQIASTVIDVLTGTAATDACATPERSFSRVVARETA